MVAMGNCIMAASPPFRPFLRQEANAGEPSSLFLFLSPVPSLRYFSCRDEPANASSEGNSSVRPVMPAKNQPAPTSNNEQPSELRSTWSMSNNNTCFDQQPSESSQVAAPNQRGSKLRRASKF
ncbi:hypothetical protein KY289_008363 [Solanum tuberosum]|nr:hypothetical protein KY289_008363 [Solanum tuberosum]